MRKLIVALALPILVAGLLGALSETDWLGRTGPEQAAARSAGQPRERAALVRTTTVRSESFEDAIEVVGSTRARQSVDLVPLASGRVEEILFRAGDRLMRDDVVLRLDDRREQTALKEAQASLAEMRNAYERAKSLSESRVSTQAALEQAEAAFLRAEAAVDRTEQNLADRVVRTPFDGVIGLRQVEIGAWVDTSTVVATFDDLSAVEVQFAVPEIYLPRVAAGQSVVARTDTFPGRVFDGEVTAIDSRINPASRAFTVRATIPNEDYTLRSGMFIAIDLVLDRRVSIALPEEAVITEGRTSFVYVLADDRAERRVVELGARRVGIVEAVAGVGLGETVISSGIQTLADGTPVRVLGPDRSVQVDREIR